MGQNETNKIFDEQNLKNVKKAKALLTHYKIDKKYEGGKDTEETEKRIATFMKVVFGKGGVIRLLADSKKTKTDSYFAVLANHVRTAYTNCKYKTYISSNKGDIPDPSTLNEINEWCKELEKMYSYNQEEQQEEQVAKLREEKKRLAKLKARAWLSVEAYVNKGIAKNNVDWFTTLIENDTKQLNLFLSEMKGILKVTEVNWSNAKQEMISFLNVCASEGEKHCKQKKITIANRKIDKVKYEVADILKNIKDIPVFEKFFIH